MGGRQWHGEKKSREAYTEKKLLPLRQYYSWIFGQSRGAIRSMDEFFKTAGMKPIGKIVCAGTAHTKELPKQTIKKIERCMK